MKKQRTLPEHVVELLKGGQAHIDFETAVKDWPANLQGKKPKGVAHSPWQVLEHMRIAGWDILEFTRDPKHVSPKFPEGYWPKKQAPPDKKAWNKSVEAIRADMKGMMEIVEREGTDFYTPLEHGEGQTVLREALVMANHNSYRLGELLLLRRMLRGWK
jgi:DinB superfamily